MNAETRDAPLTASPKNASRKAVLERFDLSEGGLHKNLKLGRFPQPFYVGGKPLWREADLQAVEAGHWNPGVQAEAARAAALADSTEARQARRLANHPEAKLARNASPPRARRSA